MYSLIFFFITSLSLLSSPSLTSHFITFFLHCFRFYNWICERCWINKCLGDRSLFFFPEEQYILSVQFLWDYYNISSPFISLFYSLKITLRSLLEIAFSHKYQEYFLTLDTTCSKWSTLKSTYRNLDISE